MTRATAARIPVFGQRATAARIPIALCLVPQWPASPSPYASCHGGPHPRSRPACHGGPPDLLEPWACALTPHASLPRAWAELAINEFRLLLSKLVPDEDQVTVLKDVVTRGNIGLVSILLFVLFVVISSCAFLYLKRADDWSLLDAIYFTTITFLTIGLGDVRVPRPWNAGMGGGDPLCAPCAPCAPQRGGGDPYALPMPTLPHDSWIVVGTLACTQLAPEPHPASYMVLWCFFTMFGLGFTTAMVTALSDRAYSFAATLRGCLPAAVVNASQDVTSRMSGRAP